MPRYNYQCSECGHTCVIFHLMDEKPPACPECETEQSLVKQINAPFFKLDNENKNQKVGELTKEYIELNREVLNEEKLNRGTYDEN